MTIKDMPNPTTHAPLVKYCVVPYEVDDSYIYDLKPDEHGNVYKAEDVARRDKDIKQTVQIMLDALIRVEPQVVGALVKQDITVAIAEAQRLLAQLGGK